MNDATSPAARRHQIDSLIPDETHRSYIDARIKDVEGAASRSRFLFGFMVVLSCLLIAMAYNSTWSWMRDMAESREELPAPRDNRVIRDVLLENVMRGWTDSLTFDVPVIGVRFSASDAGITGGLMLLVLSVWCFYAARRENHLIFYLVRDAIRYRFPEQVRRYLKNQLHATQLFSGTGTTLSLSSENFSGEVPKERSIILRFLNSGLFFLAPAALFFVLATDIYSLSLNSPFRAGGILWNDLIDPCYSAKPDCSDMYKLFVRLGASLVLALICTEIMRRAYRFQRASRDLIRYVDIKLRQSGEVEED